MSCPMIRVVILVVFFIKRLNNVFDVLVRGDRISVGQKSSTGFFETPILNFDFLKFFIEFIQEFQPFFFKIPFAIVFKGRIELCENLPFVFIKIKHECILETLFSLPDLQESYSTNCFHLWLRRKCYR